MSLANKYRPQTFDEMIGQEHISDILKAQMIARDKIHHNYLLFWPRGTGKTTSARLIAKGLNCLNLQNGNPCNECSNCQLINAGTSLDYTEIDAASHTGVDNIREEIIDKALYPPTTLQKKIYVIDEVHMLSKGAFNALLKTIEEPKSNVCFIFATTEIHKVPDTIISRCQVFNYRKVPTQAMTLHLEKICKAEGLGYTLPALETIANDDEYRSLCWNSFLYRKGILYMKSLWFEYLNFNGVSYQGGGDFSSLAFFKRKWNGIEITCVSEKNILSYFYRKYLRKYAFVQKIVYIMLLRLFPKRFLRY